MLTSSETLSLSKHRNGARAHFRYVFDTGHEIILGPIFLDSAASATTKRAELEADAIRIAVRRDTSAATENFDDVSARGEATIQDVAKRYIWKAMADNISWSAYRKLKKFYDYALIQGWTPSQIKSQLGITDDEWQSISTRWQYLSTNSAALDAYRIIESGDPGGF